MGVSRTPPAGDEADGAPEGSEHEQTFDAFEHVVQGKRQRGSVRSLPRLVRGATRTAYAASPRLFALTFGAQFLSAALLGGQVYLGKVALQQILHANATHGSLGDALPGLVGLTVVTGLAGFVNGAQVNVQRVLGERVVVATWRSMLSVTSAVDLATFDNPRFFDDLQRIEANALARPLTLIQGLAAMVGGVFSVGGLLLALLAVAPLVVPLLILFGIPLALLSRFGGGREFRFQLAQTTASRHRFYLVELLTDRAYAKEIRAFGLAGHLRDRWERSFAIYFEALNQHVRRLMVLATLSALSLIIVLTAATALLILLVLNGDLALAGAGAAIIAVRGLAQQIQQIFSGVTELFECTLYLSDLERFEARGRAALAAVATPRGGRELGPLRELRVESLSYSYPDSDRLALRDVSLRISAGQVVALVGENGSGKTTLAKLLAGLLTAGSGSVRWNGHVIQAGDADAVARCVAVIFQDFAKYAFPAWENIGIGDVDRLDDRERIRVAAARSGIDRVLSQLPDGYETMLGRVFGGVDLSVGQWQRVAIARAFFRNASLLILDEPTASLDPRAEAEMFARVRELAGGRTVLLISHRFSTVRSADQIIVLHHGRIEESGTHEELISAGGRYSELFELQAQAYR